MTEHVEKLRKYEDGHQIKVTKLSEDYDPDLEANQNHNVAARVVWYVAGVLIALLGLRFLLVLLGANPSNGFTNFIYTLSQPFVAPFFGVFKYNNLHYGVSRFETYTLLAILIYALVAFGLARLFTLSNRKRSI